ncbi:UNVERIFIED_ORG: hypothetical protein ABIB19_002643 [Arthrobacter sp. UYEF10]
MQYQLGATQARFRPMLVALLIAVPLTGAALAWLFTRARLPVSRREVGT